MNPAIAVENSMTMVSQMPQSRRVWYLGIQSQRMNHAAAATQSNGNNCDAYADLGGGDGFQAATDIRPQ